MELTYKTVTMDDARFLLDLKNDPVVRKFSIVSKNKIALKDHLIWLKKTLTDKKTLFKIIECNGRYAGDVRIKDDEISIRLASHMRSKGIGTKVIKKFAKPGMRAKIVDGNIASMRTFFSCGFKPTRYEKGVYFFKK